MDGPAFHRAAAALHLAKQKKRYVWFDTQNPSFDLAVNTIYLLIFAIKSKWSKNSFTRYWKYKEMGTYEKVANSEAVSPQAVLDTLHHARAIEVIEAENMVEKMLKERAREMHSEGNS